MTSRIVPANRAPLFLVTDKPIQSPDAGLPVRFQVLQGGGRKSGTELGGSAPLLLVEAGRVPSVNPGGSIDPATEEKRTPLSTDVRRHAGLLDLYKTAFWFAPAFGYWFDAAAKSFACCMEIHANALPLLLPRGRCTAASSSGCQNQPPAEVLERAMDIAIGAEFEEAFETLASCAASQAEPAEEVLERAMDIAIGAGA